MAVTPINSEDRLVQATFAEHLEQVLGWDSVYAYNHETFGPGGVLGRADTKEAVLTRDLRAALERLNPDLPAAAIDDAMRALTVHDFGRSMVQHNQDFSRLIRGAHISATLTWGCASLTPSYFLRPLRGQSRRAGRPSSVK